MKYRTLASFTLDDLDVDPDEITRILNIKPSDIIRKGQAHDSRRPKAIATRNAWIVESDVLVSSDLMIHVNFLFDYLAPSWNKVVELSNKYEATIEWIIYVRHKGDLPKIHFDKEVTRKAAELNCNLGVDLYILPE